MKLIVAIIQPERLDQVRQALIDNDITRITVSRCTGHGKQADLDLYRGQEVAPDLITKVRMEIAVNDDFVDTTIQTIINAARSGPGEIGDGKIFVMPIEDCIRIRTGERGSDAV